IPLARNGFDVQVLESAETIGGGARSGELTVPGVIHDHCSAAHPMGVGSPFWKEIDLERYGVSWKWPEVDCAHPLDDGTAGVLYRSIDRTVAGLGADGRRWRVAVGDLGAGFDKLGEDLMRPILHVPRHVVRLAAFGPRAVLPATVMVRWFRTEQARALFGVAAHAYTRLDRPLTAAMALMFLASGHRNGWPVGEGGSGAIIGALGARCAWRRHHGRRHCNQPQRRPRRRHRDAGPEPGRGRPDLRRCHARADQAVLFALPRRVVGVQGRLRHRGSYPVDQPRLRGRRHSQSGRDLRPDRPQRTRAGARAEVARAVHHPWTAVPGRSVTSSGKHTPEIR